MPAPPTTRARAPAPHRCEIGHHVAVAKKGAESAHGLRDTSAALDDFLVGAFGVHVPLPRVLECHDLRAGTGAVFFREEDVVVLAAVERRVEVDEVHRLILDVLAQDLEIVAVIEFVLFHCGSILTRIRRLRNLRAWYAVLGMPGSKQTCTEFPNESIASRNVASALFITNVLCAASQTSTPPYAIMTI